MPSKKKKYNARFPPARIKKIMQTDEDVGKVAAAVPVIISRALELFIDTLIEKTAAITQSKNAKTLSSSHIKQAIHSEKTFDFLRDLVKNVPDHQVEEDIDTPMSSCSSYTEKIDKKPRVPRHKKPREEGAKGPGRPRKAKVEEKKDLASEVPNEETDTDEDQTQEEDSNDQSSFSDSTPVPNQVTIHNPITTDLEERPVAHKMALPREQTDNAQYMPQNQSIVRSIQPFQNVHAGLPMQNLSFQQYPCSGAAPIISSPYISQQHNILPNSPFKVQEMSFPPHFVSTTPPGFVMSPLPGSQQLNLPQLSTPGLHQGSLLTIVPTTSSLSNSVTNNCDTSMPLSRSREVSDYSSVQIMMPILQRMPPIVLHGPQLGTMQNSQSNFTFEQNMTQAVTQSQGQLSSNKNLTVECAAENGKHKTYDLLRSPINNKSSENPFNIHISSDQNKVQLSAIASIMNTKSLDAADKDMDDDYDS